MRLLLGMCVVQLAMSYWAIYQLNPQLLTWDGGLFDNIPLDVLSFCAVAPTSVLGGWAYARLLRARA